MKEADTTALIDLFGELGHVSSILSVFERAIKKLKNGSRAGPSEAILYETIRTYRFVIS